MDAAARTASWNPLQDGGISFVACLHPGEGTDNIPRRGLSQRLSSKAHARAAIRVYQPNEAYVEIDAKAAETNDCNPSMTSESPSWRAPSSKPRSGNILCRSIINGILSRKEALRPFSIRRVAPRGLCLRQLCASRFDRAVNRLKDAGAAC